MAFGGGDVGSKPVSRSLMPSFERGGKGLGGGVMGLNDFSSRTFAPGLTSSARADITLGGGEIGTKASFRAPSDGLTVAVSCERPVGSESLRRRRIGAAVVVTARKARKVHAKPEKCLMIVWLAVLIVVVIAVAQIVYDGRM